MQGLRGTYHNDVLMLLRGQVCVLNSGTEEEEKHNHENAICGSKGQRVSNYFQPLRPSMAVPPLFWGWGWGSTGVLIRTSCFQGRCSIT